MKNADPVMVANLNRKTHLLKAFLIFFACKRCYQELELKKFLKNNKQFIKNAEFMLTSNLAKKLRKCLTKKL
jgi:hypothetical protein